MGDKLLNENLKAFIEDSMSARNTHLYGNTGRVYVRKSMRYVGGKMSKLIDLANISIDEQYQGQGIYKSLEKIAHTEACKNNFAGIYVESVLNPQFIKYFIRGVKKGDWKMVKNNRILSDPSEYLDESFETLVLEGCNSFFKTC